MIGKNPETRHNQLAQDSSRTPPTTRRREKDYEPEKKETGEALKNKGKDDLGFPPGDESKFG